MRISKSTGSKGLFSLQNVSKYAWIELTTYKHKNLPHCRGFAKSRIMDKHQFSFPESVIHLYGKVMHCLMFQ